MQTSSKEGKKVLLRVSNLKQYFPLKKKGLFVKANDGITLDIYEGETFGLVGESGCGKSTLGRTLLQLYRQTDGRTMYYGRTLDDLAPAYVKKTLQTLDKRREKWHELKKHLANVQKEYDALPDGEAKYKKHNELDKAVKDENDALLDMANLIGGFVCVKDVHPAQKLFLEEYRISSARVKEMNRRAAVQLDLDDVLFDIKKGEEKGKNVGGLKPNCARISRRSTKSWPISRARSATCASSSTRCGRSTRATRTLRVTKRCATKASILRAWNTTKSAGCAATCSLSSRIRIPA